MAAKTKSSASSFSALVATKRIGDVAVSLLSDRLVIRVGGAKSVSEVLLEVTDRPVFAAECWESFSKSSRGGLRVEAGGGMGALSLRVIQEAQGVLAVEYADDLAAPAARRIRLRTAPGKNAICRGRDLLIAKTKPCTVARIVSASSGDTVSENNLAGLGFKPAKQFGLLLLIATASTEKAAVATIEKALS